MTSNFVNSSGNSSRISEWNSELLSIFAFVVFIGILIICLPKIRCRKRNGLLRCQFMKSRKNKKEEGIVDEMGTSVPRNYIDCPLLPCVEFENETSSTSSLSSSEWCIPSNDSEVDVIINEKAYRVPLSLITPNRTVWKWEKERRRKLRKKEKNCLPTYSTSLPYLGDLYFQKNQGKIRPQNRFPFTLSTKFIGDDVNRATQTEDSKHLSCLCHKKNLIFRALSLDSFRKNSISNIEEEIACEYLLKSKSQCEHSFCNHHDQTIAYDRSKNQTFNETRENMFDQSYTYNQNIKLKHSCPNFQESILTSQKRKNQTHTPDANRNALNKIFSEHLQPESTHQLRNQLSSISCPSLDDEWKSFKENRIDGSKSTITTEIKISEPLKKHIITPSLLYKPPNETESEFYRDKYNSIQSIQKPRISYKMGKDKISHPKFGFWKSEDSINIVNVPLEIQTVRSSSLSSLNTGQMIDKKNRKNLFKQQITPMGLHHVMDSYPYCVHSSASGLYLSPSLTSRIDCTANETGDKSECNDNIPHTEKCAFSLPEKNENDSSSDEDTFIYE